MDASGFLPEGVPAGWSVYFRVADADHALSEVVALGGEVLMGAEDTPYGRLATAADPTGAVFKLVHRLMATFVLLHGAGSDSWYWHLVAPDLVATGHDVVAVDLPVADDTAGLAEYIDVRGRRHRRSPRTRARCAVPVRTHRTTRCATGCRSTCWSWSPQWSRDRGSRAASGG